MNTLLFDFDDTLAEFSQAFYDKFGVRPEGTPKERYDEMAASLVRTDFIKTFPVFRLGSTSFNGVSNAESVILLLCCFARKRSALFGL